MGKWKLILCSLGLSFIPACIGLGGYAYAFTKCGWDIKLSVCLSMLNIGAVGSGLIYFNSRDMIKS